MRNKDVRYTRGWDTVFSEVIDAYTHLREQYRVSIECTDFVCDVEIAARLALTPEELVVFENLYCLQLPTDGLSPEGLAEVEQIKSRLPQKLGTVMMDRELDRVYGGIILFTHKQRMTLPEVPTDNDE